MATASIIAIVAIGAIVPASATAGAQTALSAALNASLKSVAKAKGVTVNPRYGTWDVQSNAITGASNVLSSPEAGLASSPAASPAG